MKNILRLFLAIAFMGALTGFADAQSLNKLCFPTGTGQSCQDVTSGNPLPTTATLSAAGGINVTVTNTTTVPAIVTCTNCGAASVSVNGPFNVTLTNTVASPAIVTCTNCSTVNVAGPFNVTLTNTVASPAIVTCTNCGASSITGPFNVTVTNTNNNGQATMALSSPVAIASNQSTLTTTNVPNTIGGWTPLLITNLLTAPNAIKASAGQLGKLYCYNSNASVAYVQVFNVASGSVTVGVTTPLNTYGIPPANSSGFTQTIGDQYSTAISVAATTGAKNGTPPGTGLDCSFSFN